MCGFVGVIALDGSPVQAADVERMRDTMVYRGPDSCGLYVNGRAGLGHRRLSILDLSAAGHQPMCNEDGTVWLIFNGEIYNYVELASRLRSAGHRFRSSSDSEVIIHLYEEEGERCVDSLNGMFSFAIWDERKGTLFAARDRLGIKPFNYFMDRDVFICASEMKAILEHPAAGRTPDPEYFSDYLFAGYSLNGKTPFRDIRQLLPGHSLTLKDGRLRIHEYWRVESRYDHQRSAEETVEQLRALIDDAVMVHCRSDAPVGAHLSGGLDSSTVTAFAARHVDPLSSFSIRFDGDSYFDETAYARAVSSHVGSRYIEDTPGALDLGTLLPSLMWHLEVPMPTSGGFAYYTASRLAARHVKVSLTGHGGDEIFAGYPAQFEAAFGSTAMFEANGRPAPRSVSQLTRVKNVLASQGLHGVWRRFSRRMRRSAPPTLADLWIRLHCGVEPRDNLLLHPEYVRGLGAYSPRRDYLEPLIHAPGQHALDKCLHHDLRSYLPGLLHMEDRVSMAVSLESRVPLLDYRIVEFLATVPPQQKVGGTEPGTMEPKRLLRAAAAPLLPDVVRDRRTKVGFPVPIRSWVRGELAPLLRETLMSSECLDRGVLNADQIRRGSFDEKELFTALNVELWHRVFVDQDAGLADKLGEASRQAARNQRSAQIPEVTPA